MTTETQYFWQHAYSDTFKIAGSDEQAAHEAAHNAIDAESVPGTPVQYAIGKAAHPMDVVGAEHIARRIGETIEEEVSAWCDDETGAEDPSITLTEEDRLALGRIVVDFLRSHASVMWWGVAEGSVTQHTHVARARAAKTASTQAELWAGAKLNLQCCTLTGVDEATDINELISLSAEFPLVEWGILYSPKRQGLPGRYPSVQTIHRLLSDLPPSVRVALHVCGDGVQNAIAGQAQEAALLDCVAARGGRVQLNFNHRREPLDLAGLSLLMAGYPRITFITQHNPANEGVWQAMKTWGRTNHAVLFDASGGQGIPCQDWPQPLPIPCGYAGGMGPDNLPQVLEQLSRVVGCTPIWIDMEGKLRTQDAQGVDRFDLGACRAVLQAVYGSGQAND